MGDDSMRGQRSGDDVQDSCHSGGDTLSDERPEFLINDRLSFHALSWAFLGGSCPRRPHDLAVPREAHESWSHQTTL
jgi:hypothetical protein